MFPDQTLERRLNTPHAEADALRIDYLRLWLRTRPQDGELRRILIDQLIEAGKYAAARAELERLRGDLPATATLALELQIASREAYALPADDPRRTQLLEALYGRLAALVTATSDPQELAAIAGFAAENGAPQVARDAYRRLLQATALTAAFSSPDWAIAGQRMLAAGETDTGVALLERALLSATSAGERRARLAEALRLLESAGAGGAALALARQYADDIPADIETLAVLTRLARASGQPTLAMGFAVRLAAAAQRAPQLGESASGLAYEVLVANGALDAAKTVARDAVVRSGDALLWRQRLAQLADWTADPVLALTQWQAIARASGDPRAWAEVERRAPQLLDHATWLEALRFAQARGAQRNREIVAAHELLGQPEAALAHLRRTRPGAGEREWALETHARLAGAVGEEDERIAVLTRLINEFGATPARATELASAQFALGRLEAAWQTLTQARADATPAGRDYWEVRAQLAQRLGRDADAIAALRQLIAGGAADASVYVELSNRLAATQPGEAAAVARAGHARHGTPYLAAQSLLLALIAREPAPARAWLASLNPAQLRSLLAQADFLAARAQFELEQGRPAAALADARRGLALAPRRADLVGIVVWAGIAARDAALVRQTLGREAELALRSPVLWPAWAAGWLSLQDAPAALPWIRRQLAVQRRDPLGWLMYADALDANGQGDLAWRARRHAWVDLRRNDRDTSAEAGARLLGLTRLFAGGEALPARLGAMLARRDLAVAREAAISWAIAEGQAELAQAWMLARQNRHLAQPAWAELSVALMQGDRERMAQLIDSVADWLPVHDRITAARNTTGSGLAQSLAHEAAERLPLNDESQVRLTAALLDPPLANRIEFAHTRQAPLTTVSTTAQAGLRLAPGRWLAVDVTDRAHRNSNPALVAELPAHDRELGVTLGRVHDTGDTSLQVGARSALASFATARAQTRGTAGALQWSALGEWAGRSEDNAWLTLGAVRDRAGASLQWQITPRESLSVAAEASRYRTQTGAAIGNGHTVRAEASTLMRAAYPELALRLWWSQSDYSAGGPIDGSIAPILPAGVRSLDRRVLLPADAQQLGLAVAAGGSAAAGYTRAWRPWAELSVYRDSFAGFNTGWSLGVAGTVVGGDRLALGWEGGSATNSNPIPYRRIGINWQWFH